MDDDEEDELLEDDYKGEDSEDVPADQGGEGEGGPAPTEPGGSQAPGGSHPIVVCSLGG